MIVNSIGDITVPLEITGWQFHNHPPSVNYQPTIIQNREGWRISCLLMKKYSLCDTGANEFHSNCVFIH